MARSHLITGAKVALFVNGRRFARVMEIRWTSDTPKKPIFGIDAQEAYELAPTTARCTGSMTILKLSGDGGAEGAGLTVPFPELSREKYFSVAVVEIGTNSILFEALRCSATSQSWGAATRAYVTGSIQFEALNWSNEVRSFGG
jgi:hypothetical protein